MSKAELRRDIEYLAGNLAHRGASTKSERTAAEYIRERFQRATADVELDDFFAIENPWVLFASYYAESAMVALLALWEPWMAFGYGMMVLVLYLAEFTGFQLLGNLMPQYETQNVVARLHATRPNRLLVITAHYDSPKETLLNTRRVERFLWAGHLILVFCMVIVTLSCVTQALGTFGETFAGFDTAAHWLAVGALLLAAFAVGASSLSDEFGRGAVDNASGVAVLLDLAERFNEQPLEDSDVWLVATGSKETWLSGMRHFLRVHKLDKQTTYFLNIDRVGSGSLRYIVAEGMLFSFAADRELITAAEFAGAPFNATAQRWHGLPTDALLPLARGYKAIGITAVGGRDDLDEEPDRPGLIDYATVSQAADFAEGIARGLGPTNVAG